MKISAEVLLKYIKALAAMLLAMFDINVSEDEQHTVLDATLIGYGLFTAVQAWFKQKFQKDVQDAVDIAKENAG